MTNFSTKPWFDLERLPTTAIILSPEAINQAVEISSQIKNTFQQWQTYLNGLALFAFEQWLQERDDSFTISREQCTLLQPAIANVLPVVDKLEVNEFKLCLIAIGSLTDEEVTLPKVVVDLPEYVPHFYVLVEVLEEVEYVVIRGFLTYQQLTERLAKANLLPESDWTYQLPLTWFAEDPDRLLLYLRCLKPEAIPLPAIPKERADNLFQMQGELTALLPKLQVPGRELWQVLTSEQGTAVLTSPELLNWIYNLQSQPVETGNITFKPKYLTDLIKLLTQPAVNVGRWLWDELDELAKQSSWALLPRFMPVTAMRSPAEELEVIALQLQQQGLEIPLQARAAFKDLVLAGITLRLYAVTWYLSSDSSRWTLLLIFGAPLLGTLPDNLKLRVSDQTGILVEQGVNSKQGDSYLFTRVVGDLNEKFIVSVSLMDSVELTLPPFAFELG